MVKKRWAGLVVATASLAWFAVCSACTHAPYRWHEVPKGYVLANKEPDTEHYKTRHSTGLKIDRFDNPPGGDRAFWSADLIEKLSARGYKLTQQSEVESRNGVHGTRYDFDYQVDDKQPPLFYTAVLFVTDQHRVVIQLAGEAGHGNEARATLSDVLSEVKIGGCKVFSKVCD